MNDPIRFAVLGAGGRGREAYGSWILRNPDRARVVAVADPVAARREEFVRAGGGRGFGDWRELLAAIPEIGVDAAIVALPDHLHVEPAVQLLELGIPTLLEKPVATQVDELEALATQYARADTPVTVGHVLRFTLFWQTVHAALNSGTIGEIVTLEIRENIGFWHFAHSYVRGNWRNTAQSSPMVLAKTCHDLDLIRWLLGSPPRTISSAGSLKYFTAANAPAGAPDYCVEGCPAAQSCPFYAPRYYVDALKDVHGVPVTLLTSDTSAAGRTAALSHSNYGRCVFKSDNDVVDHQQTLMEFSEGVTATLTASAFTPENTRHVTVTGTKGQLAGHMDDGRVVLDLFSPAADIPASLRHFETGRTRRGPLRHESIELTALPESSNHGDHRGHAGGDDGLMEEFVGGLERGELRDRPELSLNVALDSHYMAFAAEESRLSGRTIDFEEWLRAHRRHREKTA